jgi:hypothetical protein
MDQAIYSLSYNAARRVSAVRDPGKTSLILGGVAPDGFDSYYNIQYDGQGRVSQVDEPKPSSAATTWLRRTFSYAGAEDRFTAVTRVGAPNASPQPASGWVRQVYFDGTGRARAEKDLAGRRSWLYWAADRDVVDRNCRSCWSHVDPGRRSSRANGRGSRPSTCLVFWRLDRPGRTGEIFEGSSQL